MADSLQASKQGLQKIEQARRRRGWNKDAPAWIDAANDFMRVSGGNISRSTLQRFWRGIPIRQENFVAICKAVGIEDWESIANFSSEFPSVSDSLDLVPSSTWVERTALIDSLLPILQGQCRILVLAGITGIGKTVLAERLIIPLQDGRSLCRLNLDDGGIDSDFASSGSALLRALGEEPTLEDQKDPSNLLSRLLNLLRSNSYRIQIDSLERLLEGNEREGWSDFCDPLWLDLLQQLLAGGECQSQIILTTQDVPGALEEIGSRYEQFWRCQAIRGLDEAEQLQLFHKRELSTEGEAGDYLKRIGKLYEGHPLVLRVIAEDLKACGGNVKRYWQQCQFDELEENRLGKLSRHKLQLEVKQRVKASLERLPEDARQLLCRASVYRRPGPEEFWLAMLPERTETQQEAALNTLKARAFAEEDWEPGAWLGIDGEIPLRQHNLIRSVAYELLRANKEHWETAERKAAEMWLISYEAAPDVPNLEKVRGYLETIHHYYEVEDWKKASEILLTPLHDLNQVLPRQLEFWGYYLDGIRLCQKFLKRITPRADITCLHAMGNCFLFLGQNSKAVEAYEESLTIARKINDPRSEAYSLGNLGIAHYMIGNYTSAIPPLQQALSIARNIGDRQGEGKVLGNLGTVYYHQGNYAQATKHLGEAVDIARDTEDPQAEGQASGNLGVIYVAVGDYTQAIEHFQQHLMISRSIGNKWGEGTALINLGETCMKLGQYAEANLKLQEGLEIVREIKAHSIEAEGLLRLAELRLKTGGIELAREYCNQALAIATELGIPLAKECRKLKEELEATENSEA